MKVNSTLSAAAILFAALLFQSCCNNLKLKVKTDAGIIEGTSLESGVKAYLGIPFAEAPVGELRWAAPQPKKAWEGVLEAKAFGPDPMQPDIFGDMVFRGNGRSEDCLYLNVWSNAKTAKDALPVLIYFNGGGLMGGSGSEYRYDGEAIAKEGVVSVTANYREGYFGFLAHPELSAESPYGGSGNYGFLDQVAAIQWVKDNIAAFGGDPERINIAGESAGSFSVSLLMVSPLSKGNLAGAILSSGAEVLPYGAVSLRDAEQAGVAVFEKKGLGSIADARALSADELQSILPPSGMPNVVLDGYFMTEAPDDIYARGDQARIPLLAGWNSQEGTPWGALRGQEPTIENYKKVRTSTFGDMTDEIFEAYGLITDDDLYSQKSQNLESDLFTGFPTWKVCDYQATTTDKPVYRYKFNRPRPSKQAPKPLKEGERPRPTGAVHSADIEYAMGNLTTNTVYGWTEDDYAISKLFLTYYANFCKYGDPNGEGLPVWTPINGHLDAAPVMQIDIESHEEASADLENAYRTLEKFYRSQSNGLAGK